MMAKPKGFKFKNVIILITLGLFMVVLVACGKEKIENIQLSETEILLDLGEEYLVEATITPMDSNVKVEWISSNDSVATVSETGLVKGLTAGKSTITAEVGSIKATLIVTVAKLEYNVIFNTDEGSIMPVQTVRRNEKVIKPDDPKKEGFTFNGWYTASNLVVQFDFNTPITANTTIYACWKEVVLNINYDTNGGEALEPIEKVHGSFLSAIDLAVVPVKEGHSFKGWFLDNEFTTEVVPGMVIESSITIYANWEVNEYTVNFDLDNDTSFEPQNLLYGSLIEVEQPTKVGYEFAGWFRDEEHLNAFNLLEDTVFGDFTLYAKWNIGKSTVMFNSNGGSKVSDILIDTFQPITAPTNPTKSNMLFTGWYKDIGLTELYDFNTPVVGSVQLYAAWRIDPAVAKKVEFELNGGEFPVSSTDFFIKYGLKPVASHTKIIIDGNPWDTETDDEYLYFQRTAATGNYWAKACLKKNALGHYEVVDFVASGSVIMGNYDYVISAWDQSGAINNFVMGLKIGQIITVTGMELNDEVAQRTPFDRAVVNVYNASAAYEIAYTNLLLSIPSLPIPVKDNAKFAGWYDNPEFTGEALTRLTQGAKLYAKWVTL